VQSDDLIEGLANREMSATEPTAVESELLANLPMGWAAHLAGYAWRRETIGRSGAAVIRLEASDRPTLFLKTEPVGPFCELPDEIVRLRWLSGSGISCPKVLAEQKHGQRHWLLMSALPGSDLTSSPDLVPERIVELAADALRQLHALDARACPFDHRIDLRIARARERLEAGLVDEEDFDEERLGRSAVDLFEELVRRRPGDEDLVVAHGDACLPNLLAQDGWFTGFIDCARLGVTDRHQDLALAAWSIQHNLGTEWVGRFFRHYGRDADPERLAYYRLLDEFF
jgi:aminoglycoside 3'-phosphotransferase-2